MYPYQHLACTSNPRAYIEIAATKSPSASFDHAAKLSSLLGDGQGTAWLGIAKATRHLALIRRDRGDVAFKIASDEILAIASTGGHVAVPSIPEILPSMGKELFKHGMYGLQYYKDIANDIRVSLDAGTKDLVDDTFIMNVFNVLYLYNISFGDGIEIDPATAAFIRNILDSGNRVHSIASEPVSIKYAGKVIDAVLRSLRDGTFEVPPPSPGTGKDDDSAPAPDTGDAPNPGNDSAPAPGTGDVSTASTTSSPGNKEMIDEIGKATSSFLNEAKQEMKEDRAFSGVIEQSLGREAARKCMRRDSSRVRADILERLYDVMKKKLKRVIDNDVPEIEIKEMSFTEKPIDAIPEDLCDDPDLVDYRIATGTFRAIEQRKEKKPRSIFFLVDKSGSMKDGNRIELSRAIVLALISLLKRERVKGISMHLFDECISPRHPVSIDDKDAFIDLILSTRCGGGTNIDNALSSIPGKTDVVFLVTDGDDKVTLKDVPFDLVTFFIASSGNTSLDRLSMDYMRVDRDGMIHSSNHVA